MKDELFCFDESLGNGFDTQPKNDYEEKLKKARILCIRGRFEQALAICEEILDEDMENMGAYIEILRVHTKDFNIFEGEEIEQDIYAIEKLFPDIDNEEYINYLQKRLKVITQKPVQTVQPTTTTDTVAQVSTQSDKKNKTTTTQKTATKKTTAKKSDSSANKQSMTKKKAQSIFYSPFLYSAKEVDEAMAFYNKLCEEGDADAAYSLAMKFKHNDIKKAVAYFKKGTDLGDENSMYQLAHCLLFGDGVTKNEKMAFEYYKQLTEKKFEWAFFNLGRCYYDGTGVSKDDKLAFLTWKKGDVAGDQASTFRVGWCYRFGIGVQKSYSNAAVYYRKCAKNGDSNAKKALKDMGYNE